MTKYLTQRLRGGSWNGRVVRVPVDLQRLRVHVPEEVPVTLWGREIPPSITARVDEYERFTFRAPGGRFFYRFYHRDHPEYKMLMKGTWNEWHRQRIRRHITWVRRIGRGEESYRRLVLWATVRALLETS